MQPIDTYRLKLHQLIASIRAWSGFIADVARVETQEDELSWRLAMQPRMVGACPLEIVLHDGRLRCDLRLAGEIYEDWDLPSLDLVLPLVQAVTEGRVVTRRRSSAMTGIDMGSSTVIRLADGKVFEFGEDQAPDDDSAVVVRDVHYLPYRKP